MALGHLGTQHTPERGEPESRSQTPRSPATNCPAAPSGGHTAHALIPAPWLPLALVAGEVGLAEVAQPQEGLPQSSFQAGVLEVAERGWGWWSFPVERQIVNALGFAASVSR